jgi:hypothetical protein
MVGQPSAGSRRALAKAIQNLAGNSSLLVNPSTGGDSSAMEVSLKMETVPGEKKREALIAIRER